MKHLYKKSKINELSVGDWVILKNSIDNLPYEIINILENNTLQIKNETGAYSGIKPSTVKLVYKKENNI